MATTRDVGVSDEATIETDIFRSVGGRSGFHAPEGFPRLPPGGLKLLRSSAPSAPSFGVFA